jgi:HEAT repeats
MVVSLPALAGSQLNGRFYLSKEEYAGGEPVFLIFELENKGTQPVMIHTADPLSFCGGYDIEVEGAKRQESFWSFGCYGGVGGSCISSAEVLKPGGRHIDRILLNQTYDLRRPGTYSLRVSHELPYGPGDGDLTMLYPGGAHETFDAQLEIVLEYSQDSELKPEFQKYLLGLRSDDPRRRTEAANVIANLAPPFLEATISQMLDSPDLKYFAVRGLRNLGTPTAHQALVSFVRSSQPKQETGAYQDAIRYLGQIGDRNDLDMLLLVARANPPDSSSRELAMESAGEVGGDDAVPLLVAELKDPSIDVKQAAVRALYLTGSTNAVPVLIELLRSAEVRVSDTAEFGLRVLTHRSATEPNSGVTPATTYAKWNRWWNTHRHSVTIFKYDQCGDVVPLE